MFARSLEPAVANSESGCTTAVSEFSAGGSTSCDFEHQFTREHVFALQNEIFTLKGQLGKSDQLKERATLM